MYIFVDVIILISRRMPALVNSAGGSMLMITFLKKDFFMEFFKHGFS